jgi:hypothetical protein
MRAFVFVIISSAVTIFGAIAAILGTAWIDDIALKVGMHYGHRSVIGFLVAFPLDVALYTSLAWLIAVVAKSKAVECNVIAGTLANIPIAAFTAMTTKPHPGGWMEALEYYVRWYIPALSVLPVFLLVGWLAKRRLALAAANSVKNIAN